RLSLGAGQVFPQVVQSLEMRRAADREALNRGGASGAAERFGKHVRVDPLFAEARPDEENDRPLAVVTGQLVEQVVERALRNQPKRHDRGGQSTLGQDEAAENKQRGAERGARACARQEMVET